MKRAFSSVMACLILSTSANAMSTFKDYWMSGTTLYSSASTDTEGVDETASATISIYGPSGSTSTSYNCTWYHAYVTASLNLTASGDHTVLSQHWTQTVATLALANTVEVTLNPEVNYSWASTSSNSCSYNVDCPGSGGQSTPICSNAPSSINVPVPAGTDCEEDLPYGYMKWAVAVKYPVVTNRFCYLLTAGPVGSTQEHGCTAP